MKEMLKSKVMIAFIVFMLTVAYVYACMEKEAEKKELQQDTTQIIFNK